MKKLAALLVSVLALSLMPLTAVAEEPAETYTVGIMPYTELADASSSILTINGTTATCKSKVTGYSDVESVKIVQTLQKQGIFGSWGKYGNTSWTTTINGSSASVSNTKTGLESGTYRLKTVFTLTDKNGKTEKITVYSDEKTVS